MDSLFLAVTKLQHETGYFVYQATTREIRFFVSRYYKATKWALVLCVLLQSYNVRLGPLCLVAIKLQRNVRSFVAVTKLQRKTGNFVYQATTREIRFFVSRC